jgi:hypothetical protein
MNQIAAQQTRTRSRNDAARPTVTAFVGFLTTLLLVLFPLLAEASAVSVAWSPNSEPDIAGYLVYFGTQSGLYSGSLNVGNVTSVQMNTPDNTTTYYFAVEAYSSSGLHSDMSAEVSWKPFASPLLTNPGSRTSTVGQSVAVQLVATDPGGLALTYGAAGLPAGLTIASATGLISGKPTTAGVYNVAVSATNTANVSATQSFAWSILAATSATSSPLLTNPGSQASTAGQAVALQLVATDPGGLALTYRATGLPAGLTIASATGRISGTPTTASVYNVSVSATNTAGLAATQSFAWTIQTQQIPGAGSASTGDSVAPTIDIDSPTSSATYSTNAASVMLGGTATDNVGVVRVTWMNDRGGLGVAVGTSTWSTPAIDLKNGPNTLTITATDAAGNVATATLTVTSKANSRK